MATRNTLDDIRFAESYLEYVSRRHRDPESRARAKILLATVQMLDLRQPNWRAELLAELDRLDISKKVEEFFPLPIVDDGKLFNEFLSSVLGK